MNNPTSNVGDNASESQLRQKLAACTLVLNDLKILGYSGHISSRLPGRDAYLIQPGDQPRSQMRPEHFLVCDFDGKVIEGPKGIRAPSEVFIHSEIFRARPDVQSVAHFHHDLTNVFTLVEGVELLPVKNHAVRWASGMPIHPDPSHVDDAELGRMVAATLGPHHAMQIRAHGQVVTAESVNAVLIDSIHFVENAEAMYQAAAIGRVAPLTKTDIDAFARTFKRRSHVSKLWTYYIDTGRASGLLPREWELLQA
jgi:ribulose-5-phosphate 4-epimerase/fuculose-1-phosphate aldolase